MVLIGRGFVYPFNLKTNLKDGPLDGRKVTEIDTPQNRANH